MADHIAALAAFAIAAIALPALGQVGPTESMEITIYNDNLGLVKDHRTATLEEGRSVLSFTDVAALIDPTSVHFKSVTSPEGVSILEQNYQFDLISQDKLLQKYLGHDIRIVRRDKDGRPVETQIGTLLSAEGGRPGVVKVGDEIILNPPGTVVLPELPQGLIIRPTLLWDIFAEDGGDHEVEVSYMTRGLSWEANYVAVVNADDTQLDLNGWVTLTNTSGARYPDAELKLIAGDVRQVQDAVPPPMPEATMMRAAGAAAPKGFEEEAFFEYHMYTLGRPTTIAENEQKQVSLMSAPGVSILKRFIFDPAGPRAWTGRSSDPGKVRVEIQVKNSEDKGLGMPLPKGKVRVFKADSQGSLQFVGEDMIDHTPRDETIDLYIGDAFDIVGERREMKDQRLGNRARKTTVEISLRNHKEDESVEVTAVEHLWGDWTIDESTVPHVRRDSTTAEFVVTLEPGEEKTISYTATQRW